MTDTGAPISRRRFAALALAAVPALAACGAGTREVPASATATAAAGPRKVAYGSHPDQFGEFTTPGGSGAARGIVVVIHGGYWRSEYGLDLMRPAAADLVKAGWATWNVEYRRVGGGGGWTSTFDDVAQALDHVRTFASARFDASRVYAVGHSAGGHLAAWLAARPGLPAGAPGSWADRRPHVRLAGVVSQAGVLDLIGGARLGDGAVEDLVGGTPGSAPQRYAVASPAERVPTRVPTICVHGTGDDVVPIAQSEAYVRRAVAAGDRAQFVPVPGVDHPSVIQPGTPGWKASVEALDRVSAG